MSRRVVITGLGVVSPLGIGIEPTFDGLVERRSGIRRIGAFDPSTFKTPFAGEVGPYKIVEYVPKGYRKAVKVMARDIELAAIAAYLAVRDAGLKTKCVIERGDATGPSNVDSTRFGANIGAGLICADLVELAGALASALEDPSAAPAQRKFSYPRWGEEGMNNLTPLWLLKFLPNMLACHVTILHDCQAPSNTITCGEASSHLAIGEAFRTIARGAADICISGGAESKVNPMGLVRQSVLGRLVEDSSADPESACRPFDRRRAGGVVSEGAGLLILEELEHAKARGANIYAEVVGFGCSSNCTSWAEPQPDGRALRLAGAKALADARMNPADIDLVGAFGYGSVAHDASEAAGLHGLLGEASRRVRVLATKGSLGNNGAGSGAIDVAVAVAALKRGVLPPARNSDEIDPACGLNVVSGDPVDARCNALLTSAMAISGGQAASLVLRRYSGN